MLLSLSGEPCAVSHGKNPSCLRERRFHVALFSPIYGPLLSIVTVTYQAPELSFRLLSFGRR